jgi:thymidylate synthase
MDYSLIVAITKNYAIECENGFPWNSKVYLEFFEDLTKDGILVMGRKTYESLPLTKRPFQQGLNVVLSNDYPKYKSLENDKLIFANLKELHWNIIPANPGKKVWLIGGQEVFQNLTNHCNEIYFMVFDKVCKNPSKLFPDLLPRYELVHFTERKWSQEDNCNYRVLRYTLTLGVYSPCLKHESQYLATLQDILQFGKRRDDRTGVGTIGKFGGQQKYDVSTFLPILTTKFVPIGIIIKELLWFLRGDTDAKILQQQGVHIWDGNSSRDFLDKRGLESYEEGQLGPVYGFQWRHFGASYVDCHTDYTGKGTDQIEYILNLLKNDPFSRRIILSAWNPADLPKMALPPCHILFQLYVDEDADGKRYLSGHLYQRSSDYFLAANYNLVSYTILLYILAKRVGYQPKDMYMSFGDVHVYQNHVEQAKTQILRNPRVQPILVLDDSIATKPFEDIKYEDFELVGYFPQPAIKAEMAV